MGGGSIDAHGELIGGKSDGSYTILLGKPHAPGGLYGEQYFTEEKTAKDEGHGGMNAGAAGGLAVGVVRGARVANAMGAYYCLVPLNRHFLYSIASKEMLSSSTQLKTPHRANTDPNLPR